jgi:hypothetical protein
MAGGAKDIYAAFGRHDQGLTGLPVPVRPGTNGEAARDAFLYLLAYSTLGTWTVALGSLMFTYIDRWFPDPLARQQFEQSSFWPRASSCGMWRTIPRNSNPACANGSCTSHCWPWRPGSRDVEA